MPGPTNSNYSQGRFSEDVNASYTGPTAWARFRAAGNPPIVGFSAAAYQPRTDEDFLQTGGPTGNRLPGLITFPGGGGGGLGGLLDELEFELPAGQPGPAGQDGQDGDPGPQGDPGDPGDPGPQGNPGIPGADGEDGEDGEDANDGYTTCFPVVAHYNTQDLRPSSSPGSGQVYWETTINGGNVRVRLVQDSGDTEDYVEPPTGAGVRAYIWNPGTQARWLWEAPLMTSGEANNVESIQIRFIASAYVTSGYNSSARYPAEIDFTWSLSAGGSVVASGIMGAGPDHVELNNSGSLSVQKAFTLTFSRVSNSSDFTLDNSTVNLNAATNQYWSLESPHDISEVDLFSSTAIRMEITSSQADTVVGGTGGSASSATMQASLNIQSICVRNFV